MRLTENSIFTNYDGTHIVHLMKFTLPKTTTYSMII